MSWETIRYNRNTLYEQVWSEPILKVAMSYGISNVGLAKICDRLKIPRPGMGYWQRLKFGKTVQKPPLPALREGESEEHVTQRQAKHGLEPGTSSEFVVLADGEKHPANRIVVPESLVEPHSLVVKAEKSLRHAGTDQFGLLRSRASGRLTIRVSRASLDRALRVMDALVKALEARQYKVSVNSGENAHTSALVLGEAVPFWIEEIVDPVERPLTAKERQEKEKYSWMHPRPYYNQVPSGRLALKIGSAPYTGIRRRVADSEKHRLEDSLNKFVEVMVLGAEKQQSERLEKERREREWKEQERFRLEEQQRMELERQRLEILTRQVDNWDRSRRIREFIADIRELALASNTKTWKIGEIPLAEWMEWALGYADKIDPVAPIRRARQAKASNEGADH
jgi:hypothetical protein